MKITQLLFLAAIISSFSIAMEQPKTSDSEKKNPTKEELHALIKKHDLAGVQEFCIEKKGAELIDKETIQLATSYAKNTSCNSVETEIEILMYQFGGAKNGMHLFM